MLNVEILEEFETITKYPLISYLTSFSQFIQNDYPRILNFYSGSISELNQNSAKNLTVLFDETNKLLDVYKLNSKQFNNYKWWELLDQIEQIETKILTIKNISRWLRSTIDISSFNAHPEIQLSFKEGQTLESINRDVLGSTDWENNWQDLAYKNGLAEEDYTPDGGIVIKANIDPSVSNFIITSIVDNPQGDRILGVDLNKKITFIDNDIDVLTPQDTFLQNVKILIQLKKGDNPEFPSSGIIKGLVSGSNINSIAYPVLFRQISDLFKSDDTIGGININSINRVQDGIFVDFDVRSRLSEIPQNLSLSI